MGKSSCYLHFLRHNVDRLMRQTAVMARQTAVAAGLLAVAGVLIIVVVTGLRASLPATPLPGPARAAPDAKQPHAPPAPAAANTALTGAEPASPVKTREQPAGQLEVKPATKSATKPQELPKVQPGPARWPVVGQVTREFGWYEDPLFKDWRYHTGIDVTARVGQTVTAVWDGVVADVYTDRHTGLTVRITTGDYTVDYSSLTTAAVAAGDYIRAGAPVGTVGAAAAENYPHLHLSIKKGEKYCDPLTVLPAMAR
ncbi:peptidase M23B [Thermosinus carboxydivorans Nor1]|uniref:Peptidase M23B n=1 Tax=Thermosinus carboxydivorans Nor1 TaxID=401526 RepID=A1HRD9_9FIRM|nr:peptidoglycan DD-metalloendopeptidase family protein [Thermosinus carboxydivorans]EAX47454.1 peptidase M23B [Thermosinus carboxydivorans Nor1]